jgi:thiol-disulfide isomerase/thioredoxin
MTMFEVLLSAGRIVLAGVFLVAGVAKLLDREGTRAALQDFGAPATLTGPLALALPLAELGVAALLIPTATAVAGAVGALALLALFSAAIALSLARGHAPECHCFGQLHSAPAGWSTLARNGALAAVAGLVLAASLAEPGTGTFEWAADLGGAEAVAVFLGLALVALLAVGAAAFLRLLRSYGRALVRIERLEAALGHELDDLPVLGREPGTAAPGFDLADARTGSTVSLGDLLQPRLPLLLVFASPGCGPCETLMPDLAGWQETHAERLRVAVLSNGTRDALRLESERHGLRNLLIDLDGKLYDEYEANGTPSAVLVAADATIASRPAAGPGAIAELVAGLLDEPGLAVGSPAPSLEHLPSLDGGLPATGRESLVMFWNPDCGFCRSMHEELLAWERAADASSPQLVIVSSGGEERTLGEGFASPVLLDDGWSAGAAFGAAGTPSAVLVDADGRVGSEVLVGADAILGRLRGPRLVQIGGRA